MKHCRVGLAAFLALALPAAVAVAQPASDESDPAAGDLAPDDGTISHESDEVIGPDDAPQSVDHEAAPAATSKNVGYDKGFFIRSDNGEFELQLSARVQPYFTMTRGLASSGERDWTGAFEIRRARLTLEGRLHGKNLLYKFQSDFGRGSLTLKDFYFDARLSGDTWLRVGQWKRPFSRQQITSSGRLETTSRSITDAGFGAERDIGVALRNDYEKSVPIEWIVGVWNGTGVTPGPITNSSGGVSGFTNVPVAFRPAFIGRVGLNSKGLKGYSEADLEGGPLRWGAAASAWLEADFDDNNQSNDKVQLDYIVKANGFSSTGGFYAMTRQSETQFLSSQELAYVGFHLQAGHMVTPKVQLVGRYAMIAARQDDLIDQQELTVGAGYYGWGHDAKVQGTVRLLKTGDADFADAILFELESNVGF